MAGWMCISALFLFWACPAAVAGPFDGSSWDVKKELTDTYTLAVPSHVRPVPDSDFPKTTACAKSEVFNFGGAYFRKLVSRDSPTDTGISAEGSLPLVAFYAERYYTAQDPKKYYQTGPLDRPSVYLGASSPKNELDCGLTWDHVYTAGGLGVLVDTGTASFPAGRFFLAKDGTVLYSAAQVVISSGIPETTAKIAELNLRPELAFRPFWRTTGMGEPSWHNPEVGSPDNIYFLPGERIRIAVSYLGKDNFKMSISSVEHEFNVIFAQKGFEGRRSFKRINSIDQFRVVDGVRSGNENRDVIPTKTSAIGAVWDNTLVLRGGAAPKALVGDNCIEQRGRDTAGSYSRIFRVSGWDKNGGEAIDIIP